MMGLSAQELDKLRQLQKSATFIDTEERHLGLLVTRRVLDSQDQPGVHYRVHPTLERLLGHPLGVRDDLQQGLW